MVGEYMLPSGVNQMDQNNLYHYQGCGLPNVWLVNGYEKIKNVYGEFVQVEDADGLHKVIATLLCDKSAPITGLEFRFLRKELDMSQKQLGELFAKDRQSIANWEKSDEVPELSDRLIRHIYQESLDPTAVYAELVHRLNELDRLQYDSFNFESDQGIWRKAA